MKIFFEKLKKKYLILSVLFSLLIWINGDQAFSQQENLNLLNTWIKGTNSGVMLLNYLNDQALGCLDLRDKEISKLKTKADWVNRQEKVKNILNEIVGPLPVKTPLNARITGVLKKDGFRVEKIIFESMPGFYVTGCLFIPDGIVGKRPAILDNIGHADGSFRNERYQNVIHNLVKKGFIVFAIDPVGQGEKDEYYDPLLKKSVIEEGVPAHCYFGDQCYVSGFSSAKYFIWDAVRAIDYLLSRKEVDAGRIGATGLSGGGTVTSYLCAFDERIKAAAPYNWAIFDRGLLETVGVQDAEANVYHGLMKGLTFADFLEMRAPKPTLMIKTTRDYLPIQGAREAYQEISKAYKAFGQEENLLMVEDDAEHQFTRKNNEATYAFFQKFLELPGDPKEVKVDMLTPEELKVSPTGLVSTLSNAETVFSLNKKATEGLLKSIGESRKNITGHFEKVMIKAIELSGYLVPENKSVPAFSGRYKRDGYSVEKYILPGEGNCIIPLLLFIPDGHGRIPAVIYLHPGGKAAESSVGGQIENLVKQGYVVAAPDLTGTGETSNKFRPDKDAIIVNYNAVLTGRSIVGIRAADIVRVHNYLNSRDDVDKDKIGAIAMGQMGPALLHAAAFDTSIKHIVLFGSPLSYRSMVLNKFYKINFECTVAGALTAYDLPDLIGFISPAKVVLVEPKDHMLNSAGQELINKELEFPLGVYSQKNVPGNLKVLTTSENPGQLMKWCFE
jgi:cephalosporin-C deacetylase-like acetyl esterase